MGSNTVVTDALVLSYLHTNIVGIAESAKRLQQKLAPLLKFEQADEVKAFAGPYVLTPTPLQWVRCNQTFNGDCMESYESFVAKLCPGWQFLIDNKDAPIVVTRYANSDIRAARLVAVSNCCFY
jgi:hypothetical protein